MRKSVLQQLPLLPEIVNHHHAIELRAMSRLLDQYPQAAELVLADLLAGGIDPDQGRGGLSGEQVLRAAIIKQSNQFSYEQLAFHLADSMSYRAFCRFGIQLNTPSATTLQSNIKKVRPETFDSINRILVEHARAKGIEGGKKVRADCTVIESNIHAPTDSSLLFDCVRVLARHVERALAIVDVPFTNHTRRAKRRMIGIMNAKKKAARETKYKDLIKVTEKTLGYATRATQALKTTYTAAMLASLDPRDHLAILLHYIDLTERVLDQTRRRVLNGESVPAQEKVVSIFEPHTDIIVKDRRETFYGHKVCLTAGRSGLVIDCVIESGNPADSILAQRTIQRQINIYGRAPRQAVFDGGFTSNANLDAIKALGVEDIVFSKARGIALGDMAKSTWVYRTMKHFRAGIESIISFLKRCFGWRRCMWRSLTSFKAYTWASVVAANLLVLARNELQ